jgi:hypothetical protein
MAEVFLYFGERGIKMKKTKLMMLGITTAFGGTMAGCGDEDVPPKPQDPYCSQFEYDMVMRNGNVTNEVLVIMATIILVTQRIQILIAGNHLLKQRRDLVAAVRRQDRSCQIT